MAKKIGVGIIGVQPGRSWAAVAHIPGLRALADDYEIVALSTTRQESAQAAAEHFGVANAFDSAEALCACDGVDLVAVTVKVPHHLELVRTALDAGKHVFCEWPLGNGIAEAREMTALAAARGVTAVCGMQARFSPALAYVRDLLAQGYVGEVLSVSLIGAGFVWGDEVNEYNAYTSDIRTGATMLAIPLGHTMDAICLMLGEIEEVRALMVNRRTSIRIVESGEAMPMTAHDQVLFDALFESGAPISVHYRGGVPRGTGLLLEINGTAGDIQVTGPIGHAQMVDLEVRGATGGDAAATPLPIPQSYYGAAPEGAVAGNLGRFYRQLARDMREGTSLCPTFADAVRRHQMVAAIEASAASRRAERPSDY